MPAEPRQPTIRDIARVAGVSSASVSYALRGHLKVSAVEGARIRAVAEKLGYRKNPFVTTWMAHVRGTARRPEGRLAFVTGPARTREGGAFFKDPRYLAGARERAAGLGFQVDEFETDEERIGPARLGDMLFARGIQVVVLGLIAPTRVEIAFPWERFACATFGYSLSEPRLHRACVHHAHAVGLAVRKLLESGYKRVALAMPAHEVNRSDQQLVSGYLLERHRAERGRVLAPFVPEPNEWKAENLIRWLKQARPDAVISHRPEALGWIRRAGWNVPEEIGFVDLNWNEDSPMRAGIDLAPETVAAAAVDLALLQITHNERGLAANPRLVLIEGTWRDGPTVRAAVT